MNAVEANLDGLVGPTHNYAGLSFGNVASEKHALSTSNPRKAALEGVRKMRFLYDLGIPQLVMPPQPRPDMLALSRLGFGTLKNVPDKLLHQVFSASSMWTANAATVSPSSDTADGKVHFTPANLVTKFHRSLEPKVTAGYLKQIFSGPHFVHHDPLPAHADYSDEGAANHMRLSLAHGNSGTEVFVYGGASKKFPARQSRASLETLVRLHGLKKAVLLEQSAEAIDAGVFHNDVIAMSNGNLFIYHEQAFTAMDPALSHFTHVVISEKDLSLKDAVSTYFFNSQLISLPSGGMAVIAPGECEENRHAKTAFDRLIAQGHIREAYYLDVRESMKNGGGPACLRLRAVLTEQEKNAVHPEAWFTPNLETALCGWIEKHYRDRISPDDLRDEALRQESESALAELSTLLKITIGRT